MTLYHIIQSILNYKIFEFELESSRTRRRNAGSFLQFADPKKPARTADTGWIEVNETGFAHTDCSCTSGISDRKEKRKRCKKKEK